MNNSLIFYGSFNVAKKYFVVIILSGFGSGCIQQYSDLSAPNKKYFWCFSSFVFKPVPLCNAVKLSLYHKII